VAAALNGGASGGWCYAMRDAPRPRRLVSPLLLRLLFPAFRYDYARDAYILRLVGKWTGPVLRRRAG
jgi:hypothetical protein